MSGAANELVPMFGAVTPTSDANVPLLFKLAPSISLPPPTKYSKSTFDPPPPPPPPFPPVPGLHVFPEPLKPPPPPELPPPPNVIPLQFDFWPHPAPINKHPATTSNE